MLRKFDEVQRKIDTKSNELYRNLHKYGYREKKLVNDFNTVRAKYESLPPLKKPSTSLIQRRNQRE
jgi:hypothetical protein